MNNYTITYIPISPDTTPKVFHERAIDGNSAWLAADKKMIAKGEVWKYKVTPTIEEV